MATMENEQPVAKSKESLRFVDFVVVGAIGVVLLLAVGNRTRPFAIAIGVGVPLLGVVAVGLFGLLQALGRRDHSMGDADFSSLGAAEERTFVGHEKLMRSNSSRANKIGFGIAGAIFVVAVAVVMGLYTPCNKFCEHVPSSCKSDEQARNFKASCEASCGKLESGQGLQLLKTTEGVAEGEQKDKKLALQSVSGREFVDALSACSFSNGAGHTCEKVVEKAIEMGLWCPEK